jgi:hypothetical protein
MMKHLNSKSLYHRIHCPFFSIFVFHFFATFFAASVWSNESGSGRQPLTLSCREYFASGEAVLLMLEVRNHSDSIIEANLGPIDNKLLDISCFRNGIQVRPRHQHEKPSITRGRQSIPPGGSISRELIVPQYFSVTEPGEYRVVVRLKEPLASASASFIIVPALREQFSQLWEVASRPFDITNRQPGHSARMIIASSSHQNTIPYIFKMLSNVHPYISSDALRQCVISVVEYNDRLSIIRLIKMCTDKNFEKTVRSMLYYKMKDREALHIQDEEVGDELLKFKRSYLD